MPATNAMIFLTLWQSLNVVLIYVLVEQYSTLNIKVKAISEVYFFSIILFLILTILNYFFLYKKRIELYNKYKNDSKKQRTVGIIIMALYIFGSFSFLFYFLSKYTVAL